MTIGTTSNFITVQGNGATTAFAYPFLMPAASDAVVIFTAVDGVQTTLLANQFTITGIGSPTGGIVTYPLSGPPIASGATLTIERILPLVQVTSIANQGPTFSAIENEFDYLTMLIQQVSNVTDRAIIVNPADLRGPTPLPIASVRAGGYLFFDGSGDPTAVKNVTPGSVPVSVAMEPVLAASTTTAALELLGVSAAMFPVVSAGNTISALAHMGAVVPLAGITSLRFYGGPDTGLIYVIAYYDGDVNDGGEGFFALGTPAADDGGAIINDTMGRSWYRETNRGPYSVRWWGAKGDGTTNDYTAIQNAISYCTTNGVGPVSFPAGNYICGTQLSVNTNGLRLIGASPQQTLIQTGSGNQLLIDFTGQRNGASGIFFNNPHIPSVPTAVVQLDSAVETVIEDCLIVGGTRPLQIIDGSADNVISRCKVYNSYGDAQVFITNSAGTYLDRVKIDQAWPKPGGQPNAGNLKGAWAATTVYGGFDVVTVSGFYLECITGGTSGSTLPAIAQYGVSITDGSVTWQLACRTDLVAANLDSGADYNLFFQCDMTGAYRGGVYLTNTAATVGPQKNIIRDTEIGAFLEFGVRGSAGAGLLIEGVTVDNSIENGSVALSFQDAWVGDATITGCLGMACPFGVSVGAGVNAIIANNQFYGMTTAAVFVAPNVNQFTITGNQLGQSTTWGTNVIGIHVATGTSNFYVIVGNNTAGATTGITDGGSGGSKSVANNI